MKDDSRTKSSITARVRAYIAIFSASLCSVCHGQTFHWAFHLEYSPQKNEATRGIWRFSIHHRVENDVLMPSVLRINDGNTIQIREIRFGQRIAFSIQWRGGCPSWFNSAFNSPWSSSTRQSFTIMADKARHAENIAMQDVEAHNEGLHQPTHAQCTSYSIRHSGDTYINQNKRAKLQAI